MHILFLSQLLPYPLDAGAKVRSFHVLQYLAGKGHTITLAALRRPGDSAESLIHLQPLCHTLHTEPLPRAAWRDLWHFGRSLVSGRPFLIVRDQAPALTRWLADLVRSQPVDAIHADQLWMAAYAWQAVAGLLPGRPRPRLVLDQHNATFLVVQRMAQLESRPWQRRLLEREARRMLVFERAACRRFDRVVWVTAEDQAALAAADRDSAEWLSHSRVIPIGIDTQAETVIPSVAQPRRVTFLGGMHWPPNAEGILWFAEEVWPRVLAQAPEAILTAIGRQPPFARLTHPVPNLDTPGYVADVTPYLAETAAFIVPLRAGGGMRVKALDAWAWGLPIVSTSLGMEGIACRHGEDVWLADDAAAFAQAVVQLLHSAETRQRFSQAGRAAVTAGYEWRRIYSGWDAVYAD